MVSSALWMVVVVIVVVVVVVAGVSVVVVVVAGAAVVVVLVVVVVGERQSGFAWVEMICMNRSPLPRSVQDVENMGGSGNAFSSGSSHCTTSVLSFWNSYPVASHDSAFNE